MSLIRLLSPSPQCVREKDPAERPPFLIGNIWEVGYLTGGVLLERVIMGFPRCWHGSHVEAKRRDWLAGKGEVRGWYTMICPFMTFTTTYKVTSGQDVIKRTKLD